MRISTLLAYALLPVALSVVAHSGRRRDDDESEHGGGNDGDDNSSSATSSASSNPSSTSSASGSTSSSAISGDLSGLTGDSQCSSLMCVSAVVNGSTVEYVMQSTGSKTPGWMAMGFGSQMANSPMVIMWTNSDGSVTLSQRQASGEVEPSVVSSPPRVATSLSNLTSTSGSTPKFGYSVPANSDTTQSIIWAFSSTNPGDSSESANLQIHDSSGTLSLDLTKALSSGTSTTDPASSGSGSGSSSSSSSLLPFQKLVIAHAVLLGVGFLILLPAGALLARWMRTFSPHWFKGHWIIQFYLAGALIVSGTALGIAAVSQAGAQHLNDDHKRWGIGIFVLYLAQCALGGIIHFVKPAPKANGTRTRPPQNYGHAVFGLLIIALAFYQVRTGYKTEWAAIGRGDAPKGVNIAWIAWIVILPILYAAGLALLSRQYKQERGTQAGHGVPLTPLSSNSPRTRAAYIGEPHNASTTALSPADDNKYDGASLNADEDPYADDVGLTPVGRHNRRTSGAFSLRPTSPRHRNSGGFSVSSRSRNRNDAGGGGGGAAATMYGASGPGVSMPSERF